MKLSPLIDMQISQPDYGSNLQVFVPVLNYFFFQTLLVTEARTETYHMIHN